MGIPLLMAEPERVMSEWAGRLTAFVLESEASTKELLKEAVEEGLLDRSRQRLIDTARAIEGRKGQVLEMFGRAGIEPRSREAAKPGGVESIDPVCDEMRRSAPSCACAITADWTGVSDWNPRLVRVRESSGGSSAKFSDISLSFSSRTGSL